MTPTIRKASGPGEINVPVPAIYCRDNLEILQNLNSESVDLVYLDPPFNTGKRFHAPVGTTAEGASFTDIWEEDTVKAWQHVQLYETHSALYRYIESVEGIGSRSAKWYLIFMAVRLIEIFRILKPTGSVFLHCDPTANSYLRLLMDSIWGHQNFANEIVWCYGPQAAAKKKFPSKHDTLLFYAKTEAAKFHSLYEEMSKTAITRYDKTDPDGRRYRETRFERDKPKVRMYLDERKGRPIPSWWTDIPKLKANYKEYLSYPTQKPLKLLERIISAATDEGDLVLDPFAGCATACEAADNLNRQWVGIDVSEKAYELIQYRLERRAKAQQLPFDPTYVHYETELPVRTDLGDIDPLTGKWKLEVRKRLYGEQEGNCKACGLHQPVAANLQIDHIRPIARGGSDHITNLQLLCPRCNATKGDRPMEYLEERLTRQLVAQTMLGFDLVAKGG